MRHESRSHPAVSIFVIPRISGLRETRAAKISAHPFDTGCPALSVGEFSTHAARMPEDASLHPLTLIDLSDASARPGGVLHSHAYQLQFASEAEQCAP